MCGAAAAAIAVLLYPDAGSDENGEGSQGLAENGGNAVQDAYEPTQAMVHSNTNAEV